MSKLSGRPIAVWFTGSDWCGWCIKLDKEVFTTAEFKAWAAQNVILVVCDFPRKTKLAPELAAQNGQLAKKFEISGYPSVIFLDANEKVLFQTGYGEGGPAAWIGACRQSMPGKVR